MTCGGNDQKLKQIKRCRGYSDAMTVTLVCDPSEATELCASQQLYLKPVAKLTISVVLPEHTGSTRAFSKWEVMDKLKNMISPDQFSSVKVSKSTKAFVRFEGEAETKRLVSSLKEKLHGQRIKLNGFKEELEVVATEAPPDGPDSGIRAPSQDPKAAGGGAKPGGSGLCPPGRPALQVVRPQRLGQRDPQRGGLEDGLRPFRGDQERRHPHAGSLPGGNGGQKQEPLRFPRDEVLRGLRPVTPDATNHFSENAIKQRTLERLTLQGLERERKREENRGRKGTERKRRDDEDKKGGEGKRRSKIKRREKRRIDREEKRPRKHLKATAAEGLNSPDLPEWEERKYLLAQRRVESIRLLTVLLSQIKNFMLSSGQTEAHLPEPQPKQKTSSTPPVEDAHKEETDAPHLEHPEVEDETQPTCPSALLENVTIDEEKDAPFLAEDSPPSPPSFGRALLNEPASRAVTSHLTENDAHPFPAGGFLQVTVTQDCQAIESSPDRWDYLRPHLGSFAEAPKAAQAKKQKVYETEEFIHYLLNYYQTPRYARICPSPQSPSDASWWNRVVSCSGDSFRVKLKNRDEDCWTEESLGSDLPENEPAEDDEGDPWEIIDGRSEPAEGQAGPREFSGSYLGEWDEGERSGESAASPLLRSPGMKPKTRLKRSGGKLWYEEPQIQWPSSEEERDLSRKRKKKRKRFSDSAFLDEEAPFLETNHRGELAAFSEIQRECSKLIRHNVKCKTLPALQGTVEIKDLIHFSASPLQEEVPRLTRKGNVGVVGERRRKAEDGQRLFRRLVER
ncbi:hypothetical protein E2320_013071 [Naja naja]|nr:hypothetical protein E2320_013071 [Naja naja]